jgi:hypothetical protein
MLTLNGEVLAVGRGKFFDYLDGPEPTAKTSIPGRCGPFWSGISPRGLVFSMEAAIP